MNTEPARHLHEREWQAQERALRCERLHATDSGDPRVARYRLIVRALRQPLPEALPADFAAQMARLAGARAALDVGVEQRLMQALVAALALAIGVVVLLYGQAAWQAVLAVWPQSSARASQWALALAACVGLTWTFELWRRYRGTAGPARA